MRMTLQAGSYLSPKLAAGEQAAKGGGGVFAIEPVPGGEFLILWGGKIIDYAHLRSLPEAIQRHSLQVDEDLYQVPLSAPGPADYVNHSCNPNAGFRGQIALVALRDIKEGEEICIDYAMCDGSPYDQFDCQCGEPNCRGRVTGEDWSRPELMARYKGYFSPYLQLRIDQLVSRSISPITSTDRPSGDGSMAKK